MPRLLFLAERFPPDIGGLASSASRIVRSLCQLGIAVDVLVWSRYLQPGEVHQEAGQDGNSTIYRVGRYRHWDMTMLHTLTVLDWLHHTHPCDAVWGHYLFPAGFLAVWFAESKGLPSTVSARGNDIDRELFPPGDFARLQWTLERAHLITAVSQDIQRKIQRLVRRQDIVLLRNTVDAQQFCPGSDRPALQALRQSLGIDDNEVVLGFSGELREKKGQAFLLSALTQVRSQRPACLLVIGEVRSSQDALLQIYASQYPQDGKRVIVTGHLTDTATIAQHLRLCDVYLQPSLWEGMPNALLEAMACGIGCIASDAGGIPEVLEPGETGFVLPRFHLHHLGEAVLEWLELPETTRSQICQNARDRILREYGLEQEQRTLQTVLERLMPRSS